MGVRSHAKAKDCVLLLLITSDFATAVGQVFITSHIRDCDPPKGAEQTDVKDFMKT